MSSAKPKNKQVRVRIAPSPTGYFHLGTARTALFNWLFARNQGGIFIVRIEDTDLERSDYKYEKDIIEGLKWLGLEWDEGPVCEGDYGPYRQSERLDIYEKYLKELLDKNLAYYCFCSEEDLEKEREAMLVSGFAPKYGGKCRSLTKQEVDKKIKAGEPRIIRFKAPQTEISFKDLIRGELKFDTGLIGDIAIAKNLRTPLYNFAVVVDDREMKITHVIRGEDHISNTPKQILIQKALGFPQPYFAHLPLILNPDRSKLSKRYAVTSIREYKQAGYLPEALINFIALLGWHPKEDREILNVNELIGEFDLSRTQKAGAIFNMDKLNWLNHHYIKALNNDDLFEKLKDFAADKFKKLNRDQILKIINIAKDRMQVLSEFCELVNYFFELPDYKPEMLIWKNAAIPGILDNLKTLLSILDNLEENQFNKVDLESRIMPLADERGRGEVFWPLRVALSGQEASAGPLEIIEILGKKETSRRVKIAIEKLTGNKRDL